MTNDITNVNRAIANIDNSIATAEDCVMESFVTLDKKYTAMEKRGMELHSEDELNQKFIENHSEIIQESSKARGKVFRTTLLGSLLGAGTGYLAGAAAGGFITGFAGGITNSLAVVLAIGPTAIGASIGIGVALGMIKGCNFANRLANAKRGKGFKTELITDLEIAIREVSGCHFLDTGTVSISKKAEKALEEIAHDMLFVKNNSTKIQAFTGDDFKAVNKLNEATSKFRSTPTTDNGKEFLTVAAETMQQLVGMTKNEIKQDAETVKEALKQAEAKSEKSSGKKGGKK